jgi:hypothetical protein
MTILARLPYAMSILATFVLVLLPSYASADLLDTPWSGGGDGTTNVVSDGVVPPAAFHYDNPGVFSGNWFFETTASAKRTVVLKWRYSGYHAFFQVTVSFDAIVEGNVTNIINAGPVNCCSEPSGGFGYSGYVVLEVDAGDTYGFEMGGSHFDSDMRLFGTLVVDELNKGDCKNDGWLDYKNINGDQLFTNQGDCVSFVATGGKNDPGKNKP